MTISPADFRPCPVAAPTPGSIKLARALAVVNLVIGLFTCLFLGFLALLGLTWPSEDGSGPPPAAYAVTAIFALALGATITLGILTARLRPGTDGARIAIVVIETIVVAVVLVALTSAFGDLEGLIAWPTVYASCGIARIVALLQPSARRWCRGFVTFTA